MRHKITYRSLFNNAINYLNMLEIIINSDSNCSNVSFGYVSSLIIELLLKSFLLNKGVSERKLRELGHDLESLWNASFKNGLNIDNNVPRYCQLLNSVYNKPYLSRYAPTNTGFVLRPKEETFKELQALSEQVKEAIF